ncbi:MULTISPECIES: hypothetical protein [Acinetobacter]|uniref:hypothetical protein n=1 Tax=Acinetobacter TaxID=469 RepID=UPI0015D24C47|nr:MULTISPECIES: hypothetical protein [Acinetobacter]UNW05754.1 hypothetical protein MOW12_14935 [Acinetobacter indicus]
MLYEAKVYAMIQTQLKYAPKNSYGRTLVLQILKYGDFFEMFKIKPMQIASNLGLTKSGYTLVCIAWNLYEDLKVHSFDLQKI